MNKQEVLDTMYASIVEDMTFMYQNAGMPEEEMQKNLENNVMAFQLICSNMNAKLLEKEMINA